MADITAHETYVRGQRRVLLIATSVVGLKFLQDNYVSTSELVSIQIDDAKDIEDLVASVQEEGLTIEVN